MLHSLLHIYMVREGGWSRPARREATFKKAKVTGKCRFAHDETRRWHRAHCHRVMINSRDVGDAAQETRHAPPPHIAFHTADAKRRAGAAFPAKSSFAADSLFRVKIEALPCLIFARRAKGSAESCFRRPTGFAFALLRVE